MRVLNYRIILFCTILLLLGVFVGGLVFANQILCIVIPLVSLAGGIVLSVITKKHTFWILTLCFAVGVAAFVADYHINFDKEIVGEHQIEARVYEERSGGRTILGDLIVDGESINGKAVIYQSGLDKGEIIRLQGKVKTYELNIFDTYSTSYFCDEIYYLVENHKITYSVDGDLTFFENLKKKICDGIEKYMTSDDAGIAESLIFGDKTNLSFDDSSLINGVGLAHVFAVSGLHIGFLAGVIVWLLKKLRIKNGLSIIIVTVVLIGYGILTGFPSGVKRAGITLIVFMLSKSFVRKSDSVTSLALATALIVITNPRELFDIGMLMSVGAVAGIVLFYSPICKLFFRVSENKIYRYFAKICATTISANAFVLPILFNVFNSFAVYSVIGNILILPIIFVTFVYIAFSAIFTAIFSGYGVLFYLAKYPVILIRAIAKLVYSLPFATVEVSGLGIATVFYIAALLLICRLFRFSDKFRYSAFGCCSVATLLCAILI